MKNMVREVKDKILEIMVKGVKGEIPSAPAPVARQELNIRAHRASGVNRRLMGWFIYPPHTPPRCARTPARSVKQFGK